MTLKQPFLKSISLILRAVSYTHLDVYKRQLHKIVKGGTDRSFGIDVAKLAGLPEEVISQARIFLDRLQEYEISLNGLPRERKEEKPENPSTSALPAYIAELKNVNIDTPVSYTHLL